MEWLCAWWLADADEIGMLRAEQWRQQLVSGGLSDPACGLCIWPCAVSMICAIAL